MFKGKKKHKFRIIESIIGGEEELGVQQETAMEFVLKAVLSFSKSMEMKNTFRDGILEI